MSETAEEREERYLKEMAGARSTVVFDDMKKQFSAFVEVAKRFPSLEETDESDRPRWIAASRMRKMVDDVVTDWMRDQGMGVRGDD